ncbi:MAG: ATP-binding cassette domain-containing protein [Acidimicrobiia bacterium]|nr:ATP-binding cassette domain-containing protein [Acidimicrobiia bacterium]
MLEIRNLSKRYGDVVALDDASFAVEPGRMLGFLGPNGAGKTTAMRAIFGLIRPDEGSVLYNDRPITDDDRARFGYMPEQRGLYPKMKVHDQLVYLGRLHNMSSEDADEAATSWLERFVLADRANDQLQALSHGNQQRVQLAAALVHDPEVLVLDEPFSGLDPMGAATMAEVLREEASRGKGVVFSSHQLDVVEDLVEDVVIVNNGRIALSGSVRGLKDASPIRRLELEVDDDPGSLLADLEGIHSVTSDNGRQVVMIDATTDIRSVLAEAERGGHLRHFIYTTPSLTDLFKEAVA